MLEDARPVVIRSQQDQVTREWIGFFKELLEKGLQYITVGYGQQARAVGSGGGTYWTGTGRTRGGSVRTLEKSGLMRRVS
jgi:hypothetical protein